MSDFPKAPPTRKVGDYVDCFKTGYRQGGIFFGVIGLIFGFLLGMITLFLIALYYG